MKTLMENLSTQFNCNLNIVKYNALNNTIKKEGYSINISSKKKLEQLLNYFKEFPLLGNKYLDYKD